MTFCSFVDRARLRLHELRDVFNVRPANADGSFTLDWVHLCQQVIH